MSSPDPSIFNEVNASQKRAVDMLRSIGYSYVPRAEVVQGLEAWKEKRKALSQLLLSGRVRV